ncbi:hypothetical protein pipiens_013098 [Culex pipiens pipiens]|uniref:Uncharacterized protein n=1 Tax=Culex pipiens pipiens TaxID=38569 RepID=A0ABD1D2D9_CULPP
MLELAQLPVYAYSYAFLRRRPPEICARPRPCLLVKSFANQLGGVEGVPIGNARALEVHGVDRNDASNAESSNAETDNAKASNAETDNAEASNAETDNAEASNAEASNVETDNAESSNAESSNAETDNAEASNAETDNAESSNAESSNANVRESCIGSSCKTYKEVNTLWCHADPTHFCQCRTTAAGTWQEAVMPCARAQTYFSFRRQTCVTVDMWDQAECLGPDELMGGAEEPAPVEVKCEHACVTYADISTLWCHPADRDAFCQCRPTAVPKVFEIVKMPCANGTLFSFKRQTCMQDSLWADSCPQ